MQRILILGNAGSGKTCLANKLAELLDLNSYHLDYYFWQPGWKQPSMEKWETTVKKLLQRNSWILDGNYCSTLPLRLSYADTVIFLELNRITCLLRCFGRFLRYCGRNRPDLAQGCPETFDREFIRWIWSYPAKEKPRILSNIKTESNIDFILLRSKKEIVSFLQSIRKSRNSLQDGR
jgi:adenylate kinase family enzyme